MVLINNLCINEPSQKLPSSAVTTPDSVEDEEIGLFEIHQKFNLRKRSIKNWITRADFKEFISNTPYLLICISIVEACFYMISDYRVCRLLRFEPSKRYQVWRYMSYMLVHDDLIHLALNLILQCMFAYFLEPKQGRLRIFALYLAGGVTGVLGASCINPGLLVGASAGVYSLLLALMADLYVDFKNMKYRTYRCICIVVLILSDIFFNLHHYFAKKEPLISWEAHIFGGITGLLIGLVIFKTETVSMDTKKRLLKKHKIFASVAYFLIFFSLLFITIFKRTSLTAKANV